MATHELSSYVHHLPPALWADDSDPARFLGRALRVFEKLLTGIDDGVPAPGGRPPPAETIAGMQRLFSPRHTPQAFVPWLAAWVSDDLRPELTPAQRRVQTAAMAEIQRMRGTLAGLVAHLVVFEVLAERPRIVVDTGDAVFQGLPAPGGGLALHALAHSTPVRATAAGGGTVATTALLHPTGLAVDGAGRYVVADQGDRKLDRPPSIWRLSHTGAFETADVDGSALPAALYVRRAGDPAGTSLTVPVALTADAQDRYAVVDLGPDEVAGNTAIRRLDTGSGRLTTVIDQGTDPRLAARFPVDMVLDDQERFVLLDRGAPISGDPPLGAPARPALVVVREDPLEQERHALDDLPVDDPARVVEPTALAWDGTSRFVVADAREQLSYRPANLVLVDPADGWSQTALLAEDTSPLVHPTGLAFVSPDQLLVCDTGLRHGWDGQEDDQSVRYVAEPPAIYRVDLGPVPATVTRVTSSTGMVWPSRIAVDRRHGCVVVTDRGESLSSTEDRSWRTQPHEFGVLVHFAKDRLAVGDAEERFVQRRRIRHAVSQVVDGQRPAHTLPWLKP